METNEKKRVPDWLKRLIFILLAIIATLVLKDHPVFSFQEDKGIIYIRSFTMDNYDFYVIQTNISTGASDIIDIMSVSGLHFCAWAILVVCGLTFIWFWDDVWRMRLCVLAAVLAGVYYIIMIYYALEITDEYFTTLYPNIFAVLPAIVLQLMLIVRRSIARTLRSQNDDEEKEDIIKKEE